MLFLPEIETRAQLEERIANNDNLPASMLYCIACIQENVLYLNGSPHNTFQPSVLEMATDFGSTVAGNDFKSGQTRFKTAMGDFLIGSGLRLSSVVSYNHLGNNDGKNLAEEKCFESKRISKSGVLDDAIRNNKVIYPDHDKNVDHDIVIRYIPFVGDSKKALDEYSSKIFMGGTNTIMSYNICEDTLLATPMMIDMVVIGELLNRITIDGKKLGPVLSYLGFFYKAPSTNHDGYVVHSYNMQREILTSLMKAAAGFANNDNTLISFGY